MKYERLYRRIKDKYKTVTRFARKVGMLRKSVALRLKGETHFTEADIEDWCEALDINTLDIDIYFLPKNQK